MHCQHLPAEVPLLFVGKVIVKVVSVLVKGLEVLRIIYPVLNNEAEHLSPCLFGVDGDISES